MSKFNAGNLIETAKPVWMIDAEGNVLGSALLPVHVTGSLSLIATEDEDVQNVDAISKALITIDLAHHEVHDGYFFETSHYFGSVANTATFTLLLRTGARYDHITWNIACGGDAEVEIIAEPTVTNTGTAIAIYNMNRPSTVAPLTAAWHTPTISGGNILEHFLLPGGKGSASGRRHGAGWRRVDHQAEYLLRREGDESVYAGTTSVNCGAMVR